MREPGRTAIGTWSGGRFMHFGEPLDDERLEALFRPGPDIDTVITADVYGAGDADRSLGRALAGLDRENERLREARQGKATVGITASPLMLDQTDHVFFVEDGRVVAEGTHRELLRTSPAYRWTVTRGEDV